MSCIRTVLLAAGVSFVIILPWLIFSSYSDLTEMGALVSAVAAIAAALGAFFAGYQICSDNRWRKRDRTYSHSPTRNESFQKALDSFATDDFKRKYPGMELEQRKFRNELKREKSEFKFEGKIDENLVIPVANLWGQMASEYYADLLDRRIAKEVLWFRYMRFVFVFEKWLSEKDRMGTYDKTIKLYKKWKKD